MSRNTYLVRAQRSGDWWAIEVPEVAGAFTQARRIEQIEATARELVGLMLDVAEDSFDLKLDVVLPEKWEALVRHNQVWQRVAAVVTRLAAQHAREAAATLYKDGLPIRDVGTIMGISAQRVSQLLHPSQQAKIPSAD